MAYQYIYTMKGLTRVHPPDRVVLKDIWLAFLPGAKIGVLGANGAGKTTLFRMITGKETPDAGTVRLGETVRLGCVDQNRDALDPDKTA